MTVCCQCWVAVLTELGLEVGLGQKAALSVAVCYCSPTLPPARLLTGCLPLEWRPVGGFAHLFSPSTPAASQRSSSQCIYSNYQ